MVTELYSLLPLVVAVALLGYVAIAERKAARQQPVQSAKWNDYMR